ncbi:unnamed protein product, partial [Medioppia subpectinata]
GEHWQYDNISRVFKCNHSWESQPGIHLSWDLNTQWIDAMDLNLATYPILAHIDWQSNEGKSSPERRERRIRSKGNGVTACLPLKWGPIAMVVLYCTSMHGFEAQGSELCLFSHTISFSSHPNII